MFYHELFKAKGKLPIHISRLLIFAIANSFDKKHRRQIFNDNNIQRKKSNCWLQEDLFVYDFQVSKLYSSKFAIHKIFDLHACEIIVENIQLPLFFVCSSLHAKKKSQVICLEKVNII
jgi:hypothetical protein